MPLIKRTPKPDPEAMYECLMGYAGPVGVFPAGARLKGDHPAVRAHFGQWMLDDLPDDEKGKLRGEALWGEITAEGPQHSPAPRPMAQPPSGRFRAVRSWTLPDPDLQHRRVINAGELVDADDEVFRRYPHLYVAHIEERGS